MKFTHLNYVLMMSAATLIMGCNSSSSTNSTTPTQPTTPSTGQGNSTNLSAETLALGISEVPATLKSTYSEALNFNRYAKYDAPNGKAIHIIAQNQVTDNQIIRAHAILTHY